MLPRIISPTLILSPRKMIPIIFILSGLVSSCSTALPSTTAVADFFTPTSQVLESTPTQTSVDHTAELTSSDSDRLGLCFSYPQGYTQIPDSDTVEIAAPDLPGTNTKGLFWLEISNSYDRSAEKIADQDMTYASGGVEFSSGIILANRTLGLRSEGASREYDMRKYSENFPKLRSSTPRTSSISESLIRRWSFRSSASVTLQASRISFKRFCGNRTV